MPSDYFLISGGYVYDPANGIDGQVKDMWISDDKIVESKLVASDGTQVAFNYRMHTVDGHWKIVDIYLNGNISQLALRRADFASTVQKVGPTGLVEKLNQMVDKQMTAD